MQKFDLYWVDFIYEEEVLAPNPQSKRRPVLICGDDMFIPIYKITSNLDIKSKKKYEIKDFLQAGLDRPSVIDFEKVKCIAKSNLNSSDYIGHLSESDINAIKSRKLTEELSTECNIFYHATYKQFIKSIMLKGLGNTKKKMWPDAKPGVICLSTDKNVAASYAEESEWLDDREDSDKYIDNIVILYVDSNKLDKNKLFPDSNIRSDDYDSQTYEYNGIIPWEAITQIEKY